MADIKTSSYLSINWRDAGKAAIITALAMFFATGGTVITEWLNQPTFHFEWAKLIVPFKNAIYTGLAVIVQRFIEPNKAILTNISTNLLTAIKTGEAKVTVTPTSKAA